MARSPMQHSFARVPSVSVPRSSFNRKKRHLTTFNAGYLIPIYVDEILPGDTVNFNFAAFARFATPLHPFMDNAYLDCQAFFVPYRLVWDNFQRFMGERDPDPDSSTDYLVPIVTASNIVNGTLGDYLGWPTGVAGVAPTALVSRSYNLIWNEWYRDQNMQDSVVVDRDDGPDSISDYVLLRRGKRHDYFTSCLPFAQKGDPVELPLTGNAPVSYDQASGNFISAYSTAAADYRNMRTDTAALETIGTVGLESNRLYADLSAVAAATINSLRLASTMQQFLELDARAGTRYVEVVKAHFGVTSPDARLQRPEFLGGGESYINITPVAQTSEDGATPQGNLAGYGTASLKRTGFTKSFVEHGTLMVMVSIRADLTYQQGLHRMWSRRSREEFYWPTFAHIGEQAVLNKEIYFQGTADDALAFGYQEPYAEYRYGQSMITGQFRSNFAQSLDTWHLAQEFSALPALGNSFIVENPPVERIIAVTTEPHMLFDGLFEVRHARPMPVFGVPGLTRF